uniref:Acyl-CoA dehydrogenase n=1 Tax=Aureoumbra lagunensis TaxID=44058 RepID=A0A7S3K3H5_9STRA|mmetsp:Transcript_14038/g.18734  ORF Transcript_14038/g.18734 Transcript_14038/m.18734 type:complete len:408 (+) Transcript_14038:134-1357(+)
MMLLRRGQALQSLRCLSISTAWSESEEMLRNSVRRFADEVIRPKVLEMDTKQKLDEHVLKGLFDQGLLGIEVAEEYGGSEFGFCSSLLAIEEIARVDPSVAVLVDVQNTLVNAIFSKYGNSEQKEEWLSKLSSESVGAFCLTEPTVSSDAFSLKTRADKDEIGNFLINGTKTWVSNALEAEVFLVLATVDPNLEHRGVTCFIIPRDAHGLKIGQPEAKLGIRASSTCSLTLTDVRLSSSHILGGVGNGYDLAIETLGHSRLGVAALMLGLAQGALDCTLKYVHDKYQYDPSLNSFKGVQFQVAQMATELEALRSFIYTTARKKMNGHHITDQAAKCKLFAAQVAERLASSSVELHGGVGFTSAYPAEKFYRDAKIGAVYAGSNNMMKNIIAKHLLHETSSLNKHRHH